MRAIKTLTDVERSFPTEEACLQYLTETRWPGGKVQCPRCHLSLKVYKLKRPFRWVCKGCHKNGYRFSPLVGTIYENTNVPLRTWFKVIYMICVSKKGVSAMQVQRMIDPSQGGTKVSYRTAWYMLHRIRAAMKDDEMLSELLTGEVEIDETYVGGSDSNKHRSKLRKEGRKAKVPVIGAIARKGSVVAKVIENANEAALTGFVQETVSTKVSLVSTDEHRGYNPLGTVYPHETVNHTQGEYVRGNVHTAHIDQFWSMLKRGIMGTFHQVSKDYLPLYVAEFAYRHNHRDDADMFRSVVAGC